MPASGLLDKPRNVFNLVFIFRSKTLEPIRIINKACLRFLSHEVDYLGEHWLS